MISREQIYAFIDVSDTTTPEWKLLGERIESMTKDFNTNEQVFHPITSANPIVTTTSFAKSSGVTQIADPDDPVFSFIDDIFWKEKKGNQAKSQILEVAPHRVIEGEGEIDDAYEAKISDILISQQSEGGDGGGNYEYSYNIHWVSDPVFGSVIITGGVPAFTADNGEEV